MAKTSAETTAQAVTTETRWRVKINPDKGAGGGNNVDLGVNGVRHSLERGKELLLTAAQLEALENAETQGYSVEIGGKTHVVSPIKRYSYNVYGSVEVPLPGASPEGAGTADVGSEENGVEAP